MPHCCSVPNCNGNYRNGPKVAVFSFPKEPELHHVWLRAIKRDFVPTPYSKVCELHFAPQDILREVSAFDERTGKRLVMPLKIPKLRQNAVPSRMPNCPAYMSTNLVVRESPAARNTRKEEASLSFVLQESFKAKQQYDEERSFNDFDALKSRLSRISSDIPKHWSVIVLVETVLFCLIAVDPHPCFKCSVAVSNQLDVKVYIGNTNIDKLGTRFAFPNQVRNVNEIADIIAQVDQLYSSIDRNNTNDSLHLIQSMLQAVKSSAEGKEIAMGFLEEQVGLLQMKRPTYSCEMIVFATLLSTISPHAYRFIRSTGNIQLPHPSTIKRVCTSCSYDAREEQSEANFLKYIAYKAANLEAGDKRVSLMVDEVHVKPYLDYKGGNITGMSYDGVSMASSAHVFMICGITSTFKDVVHILPTKSITHAELHSVIKRIVVGLEEIGFCVISVITDNNAINRKAMSLFSEPPSQQIVYPHPSNKCRPLFFVIDPVHLLKCIRNNWLNQKNLEKCMYFPNFPDRTQNDEGAFQSASLLSLRKLHECEVNSLAKFGYNLTLKALFPSNLERQNVNLVLKIFNPFVVEALLQLGPRFELPHFSGTAVFIRIIHTWWSIMNVKSPYKGAGLNDVYKFPLKFCNDDVKLVFLKQFLDWLDQWKSMHCSTGALTNETHAALKQTTYAIIEIASYCKAELGLEYILPGKYQTDQLENRFSVYRQLAGGQYNVSMRQIYEGENKLRMQSTMKLYLKTKSRGTMKITNFTVSSESDTFVNSEETDSFSVNVTENDINSVKDQLPVLKYIGGYVVHCVAKKLKCEHCNSILSLEKGSGDGDDAALGYTAKLDRGRLTYPTDRVVEIIVCCFIVVTKLCFDYEDMFMKKKNQRVFAASVALEALINGELLIEDVCSNGHTPVQIIRMIVWSAVNIFLCNYCKERNNTASASVQKKRKLQTFSS